MEPIDFAHKKRVKKAQHEGDCKYQTPEDCLKIIADDLKSKLIRSDKFMIVWRNEDNSYGI
jgi:hypothetical protein